MPLCEKALLLLTADIHLGFSSTVKSILFV